MSFVVNGNLNRRDFLKTVGLVTVSLAVPGCTDTTKQFTSSKKYKGKPNIVLFLADDQGIDDVGCYGNNVIRTLNIDCLAEEGLRFKLAFTPTAMCSPSRSVRTITHKYIRNLNPEGMFQCVSTHGHDYKEIDYGTWGSWKEKGRKKVSSTNVGHERPVLKLDN